MHLRWGILSLDRLSSLSVKYTSCDSSAEVVRAMDMIGVCGRGRQRGRILKSSQRELTVSLSSSRIVTPETCCIMRSRYALTATATSMAASSLSRVERRGSSGFLHQSRVRIGLFSSSNGFERAEASCEDLPLPIEVADVIDKDCSHEDTMSEALRLADPLLLVRVAL